MEEMDYVNALPHPILPVRKLWDREDGIYYVDAKNRYISPEQILEALNGYFAANGESKEGK